MKMYDLQVEENENGDVILLQSDMGEQDKIVIAQVQLQAVIEELQKLKK